MLYVKCLLCAGHVAAPLACFRRRTRRSASSAAPTSGLTRVFSAGVHQAPVASLTSPFEDKGGFEAAPASAPDRPRLPVMRFRGTTVRLDVDGQPSKAMLPSLAIAKQISSAFRYSFPCYLQVGQALLRVLMEARERDEVVDAAADALPIDGQSTEYTIRVASDTGMPEDVSDDKAFGRSGDALAGPWEPDCDFPSPDTKSILSSIGVSVFVITRSPLSAVVGTGSSAGAAPTSMEVVPAPLPAAASASAGRTIAVEDADASSSVMQDGAVSRLSGAAASAGTLSATAGAATGASTGSAPSATAATPICTPVATQGPWEIGGETVVMRLRLPERAVPQHAGEMRSLSRAGAALTLTVERPTRDGLRLAARYQVTIEATPAPQGGSEAGMTDAPPASELASSLLSGVLVMTSPVA